MMWSLGTIKRENATEVKRRAAAKRAKLKEQRARRKAREQATKARRKEKRAAKAAPRNRLNKWSQRVRECGVCAVCGIGSVPKLVKGEVKINKRGKPIIIQLNAHHLLPKERYPEFRFKTINGVCLCPEHHKYGRYSAHRNPIWFVYWLMVNRPRQHDWCLMNMGKHDGA